MQPDLLPEFLKVQGLYDRCLSVCPDLWSSSCFLPALTAKNQRYEITACFVKNSDWTEERKPEVLSLIGCSLYLFVFLPGKTAHEQLKIIIIKEFNLEAVSCLARG